jgi:tRNA G10  N-methylase Trm11
MKTLDPFCGVTGMDAAARLGVDGIGIDLDLSCLSRNWKNSPVGLV